MVIKPKVRGFLCTTTHPVGCDENVRRQIEHVKSKGDVNGGPKRVLVLGASTGYKRWTDLTLMMLDDNAATEISKIDLYYAYQLCDILNIKTIKWSMFDNYTTDDKEQRCVYDFLEENLKANPKENKHLWSDDDVHLNKVWQKRMLRKYLIPIINYKLENKND